MNNNYQAFTGKFIVQTDMMYGWDAIWSTEDDQKRTVPDTYDTQEAAQAEIDDNIESTKEAISEGFMDSESLDSPEHFRIAQADMDIYGNVTVYEINKPDFIYQTFNVVDQY